MTEVKVADAASGAIPPGEFSALLAEIARAAPPSGGGWERWLRPGAVVGRFELVREIGRGGFGVVWEARDRQLGRAVAFKAVRPGDRIGPREERLLREAEAAARLSHPGIVTLFEAGHCEHGPYLVLELLRGRTLAARISTGPVALRETVRIAVEICGALAHAHAQGVVHRDLKPGNVFVCDDGRVKLLDLGMAHAFGTRRADGGTPAYMAPEQARGAPEDERTDVFALGVLLYRMLAGVLPFASSDARPPSFGRAPPSLEITEAPALGGLVSGMLALDPVDRPRDAGEVLPILESVQSELDRSGTTGSGTVRRKRRGLRLAGAAGGAVALTLAGTAIAWWAGQREPTLPTATAPPDAGRPAVVVADTENNTGENDLDGLSRVLSLALEQSRRIQVLSRSRVQGLSRWSADAPLARIDAEVAREAGHRAAARAVLLPALHRIGSTYVLEVRAEAPASQETLFTARETSPSKDAVVPAIDRLSDRIRREMGEPGTDVETARIDLGRLSGRSLEAYDLWLRAADTQSQYGEVGEARKLLLRAVEVDPDFALATFVLGELADMTGEPDEARARYDRARRTVHLLPDRERSLLELLLARGDGVPREELDRLSRALADRYPNDKLLLLNAAQVQWLDLGDRRTAEALYRRGLALDPGLMCLAWDLVHLLSQEGRTADAVTVARRAVAERPSAPNKTVLAEALAQDGSLAEALEWARDAVRVAGGRSYYVTSMAPEVLLRGGAADEAEAEYRRVAQGSDNPGERRVATLHLVGLLAIQGRLAEARRLAAEPGALPTRARRSPETVAFIAGSGHPRLSAPAAVDAIRGVPTGPMTAAMLGFHGDLTGADDAGRALPPDSKASRYLRAIEDHAAGRHAEAATAFRALAEETPSWRRHQFLYLAGEAFLEAGRPGDAVEVLRPATGMAMPMYGALDVAANFPRGVLVRVRALQSLGRNAEALDEVNRLLKQWARADPGLPLLAEARATQERLATVR